MRSVDAEWGTVRGLGRYSHGYAAARADSRVHLVSGAVCGLTAIIGFTTGATALGVLMAIPAAVLGGRLLLWDLP
ncbi:hypothetical protein ACFV4K_03160 [Nocardia sp. NPDC059764]|uniref:hypothetical protein n=1 Tax=Nocardia sp. NPDC059764 TaxID=3346939 RepID=UPI00364A7EEB